MTRIPAVAIVLLSLLVGVSRADIYRWEDDKGTVHFTDDLSNIPPAFRGNARTVIREAPPSPATSAPKAAPAQDGPQAPAAAAPGTPGENQRPSPVESERDRLTAEVEQLRAKIAAKEKLVQAVDEKQSLTGNPYRNRVVDPADLDLYNKYKSELPQDRETLKELESRL